MLNRSFLNGHKKLEKFDQKTWNINSLQLFKPSSVLTQSNNQILILNKSNFYIPAISPNLKGQNTSQSPKQKLSNIFKNKK